MRVCNREWVVHLAFAVKHAFCSPICCLQVCITVAMLFSSPVFQGSPSQMLLWPLVPLFVNRVMEIGSFLLGKAWAMVIPHRSPKGALSDCLLIHAQPFLMRWVLSVQLSLLQIALALVAVGLYIWVIDCGPVLVQEQNSTPLLLPVSCSAQIVMATMLCFIEVSALLRVRVLLYSIIQQ